jgi:hypothetical protein
VGRDLLHLVDEDDDVVQFGDPGERLVQPCGQSAVADGKA